MAKPQRYTKDGNTYWRDAIELEMKNVSIAFKLLELGEKAPPGHTREEVPPGQRYCPAPHLYPLRHLDVQRPTDEAGDGAGARAAGPAHAAGPVQVVGRVPREIKIDDVLHLCGNRHRRRRSGSEPRHIAPCRNA